MASTTTTNTDFLRFSAYSLKDLITRKLSEDSNFTDQIYEGSNLATLIDLVAYMYQCLVYQLNNAAAESMFSDTQIYKNINRLVSMIGYNPKGCIPAVCQFAFDNVISKTSGVIINNYYGKCIMPYSAIDTGKTDDEGNPIYYSTVEPFYINNDEQYRITAYNGLWKMYNQVFVASGQPYDTFVIDGLRSDASNDDVSKRQYVMWPYVDVYVRHYNSVTGEFDYKKWKYVSEGLFTDNDMTNGSKLYSSNDPIYNIRLLEDKTYEIKFGNGINGKMPEKGDEIVIFYLEGNGASAKVEQVNSLVDLKLHHSPAFFGISSTLYTKMFADYLPNAMDESTLAQVSWANITPSTDFVQEEDVKQIQTNAPHWFKRGNRLITSNDYVDYLKERYSDNVIDVVVMNNWSYISTFYKWLYNLGLEKRNDATYYLNQNNLIKYDYKYADACDSNNIYLWVKMKNEMDIYNENFKREITNIKTLTSESVFVKPIDVYFMVSAKDAEEVKKMISNQTPIEDSDSYIEILLNNSSLYTNDVVAQRINNIVIEFFKPTNFKIGESVDYNNLLNNILAIDGVDRIRTVCPYTNDDGETKYKIVNGISFATWSSTLVRGGDDLQVSNTTRIMEPFQFPALFEKSITGKIKVIKQNTNMINNVYY